MRRLLLTTLLGLTTVAGRAQQSRYLTWSCLLLPGLPAVQRYGRQLTQAGIHTFVLYRPAPVGGRAATVEDKSLYLLWTDHHRTWVRLVRPDTAFKVQELPGSQLFTLPFLGQCGAIAAEDRLKFRPPVPASGSDFVVCTSPTRTFYFEYDTPADYSPNPQRQLARQGWLTQLKRELARLRPRQQVEATYRPDSLASPLWCGQQLFGR